MGSALAIIIEEILEAGVSEICVVIFPGDRESYQAAAGQHAKRLTFVEQPKPLGYGHAVWCAKEFSARQPKQRQPPR